MVVPRTSSGHEIDPRGEASRAVARGFSAEPALDAAGGEVPSEFLGDGGGAGDEGATELGAEDGGDDADGRVLPQRIGERELVRGDGADGEAREPGTEVDVESGEPP